MAQQQISAADRIRELSAISAQTATMIEAAGKAVTALTNSARRDNSDDMDIDDSTDTLQARQDAFSDHVNKYYTDLQAVIARLRRQTYALEEAGIISAEAHSSNPTRDPRQQAAALPNGRPNNAAAAPSANEQDKITNGGLGFLNVGYLNSRGNKVTAEKEAELMREVKTLLQELTSDAP